MRGQPVQVAEQRPTDAEEPHHHDHGEQEEHRGLVGRLHDQPPGERGEQGRRERGGDRPRHTGQEAAIGQRQQGQQLLPRQPGRGRLSLLPDLSFGGLNGGRPVRGRLRSGPPCSAVPGSVHHDSGPSVQHPVMRGRHHDRLQALAVRQPPRSQVHQRGTHPLGAGRVQVGRRLVRGDQPAARSPGRPPSCIVSGTGHQARQHPGQPEPAALPRAQIVRTPCQHAWQGAGGERMPDDLRQFGGLRSGRAGVQLQLALHGGLTEGRVLPQPRHRTAAQSVHAPSEGGRVLPQHPGQGPHQRGLAGARGPREHRQPGVQLQVQSRLSARRDGPDDGRQGCAVRVPVGDAHLAQLDRSDGDGGRLLGWLEGGERVRDRTVSLRPCPAHGLHPVLGGVVRGPDVPERQIHLRGQGQHQQAGVEVQLAVDQTDPDEHGHHRHGEGADQLQGEAGHERGPQGGHRGGAVALGDLGQRLTLGPGTAQPHQDRQPACQLQQVVGEPVQSVGGLLHPVLGVPADQHHEQRDQRDRQHQDQRRDPVVRQDPHAQSQRHHGGRGQCGQVLGEPVVHAVQPGAGQHRIGPGPVSPGARRVQSTSDQGQPQLLLGAQRRPPGHHLLAPDCQRTSEHPEHTEDHREARLSAAGPCGEAVPCRVEGGRVRAEQQSHQVLTLRCRKHGGQMRHAARQTRGQQHPAHGLDAGQQGQHGHRRPSSPGGGQFGSHLALRPGSPRATQGCGSPAAACGTPSTSIPDMPARSARR